MSTLPRISVLLPVYNGERFLRQAIASILNQTFTDFEFLIIDDGSVDATASIVRSFQDPRIRFFARSHEGLVAQLNFGIQAACAPLLARFDADDIAHPRRLELQVSFLDGHPEIGVAGSSCEIIDESGAVTAVKHLPSDDAEIRSLLSCHNVLCHPSVSMRKNLLEQFGGYDADDYPAEDYGLWLRMLPHTMFYNFDIPLVQLRRAAAAPAEKQELQRSHHHHLSLQYLQKILAGESTEQGKADTRFAMARTHYYFGSMADARSVLAGLIAHKFYSAAYWRYFIPSFLGDSIWRRLRRSGFPSAVTNPLRKRKIGKGSIAP